MTAPHSTSSPAWVRKRDGRLVPFEADRISRALFAASETAGRPDAFLARELADVVVHFLADETDGTTPSTEQVHEVVVKVLRELKQPALGAAFEARARARRARQGVPEEQPRREGALQFVLSDQPEAVRDACLRSYTLQTVFTRDLVAAHQDGLLALGGLETPGEMAASLVGPFRRTEELLPRIEEAAAVAGQTLALEGIEHILARALPAGQKRVSRRRFEGVARDLAGTIQLALRLTGRQGVVNLNGSPPPWASAVADGPLFGEQQTAESGTASLLADALAEALLDGGSAGSVRVDWHLSEADFRGERLLPLARAALAGAPLAWVFDRPRHPVALGEGLERGQPAVLLAVGLHLPQLAKMVQEEGARGSERMLEKLGSLGRLALSAALQKREYLRRRVGQSPGLGRGFLLERARLLVMPLGLDEAVTTLLGQGLCASDEGLALGCAILRRLREVLGTEGRASTLETCLDATANLGPEAPVKNQLRVLGALHAAAGGGSGTLFLPPEPLPTAEQVAGWLRWAWGHTSIVRVRLQQPRPPLRQMTFE